MASATAVYVLIFFKNPMYPKEAVDNKQNGYAKIRFDVAENGCTYNHVIIESYPNKIFGDAGIKAAKRFR